jgi:hypothetical protein
MIEIDFPTTLRKFRDERGLSTRQMAELLAVSEQNYRNLEQGTLVPEPVDEKGFRHALLLHKIGPSRKPGWYQSRKWHWLIPVLISTVFFLIVMNSVGFREGRGRDSYVDPPYRTFVVFTLIFCLIYWCFWRPGWLIKLKKR